MRTRVTLIAVVVFACASAPDQLRHCGVVTKQADVEWLHGVVGTMETWIDALSALGDSAQARGRVAQRITAVSSKCAARSQSNRSTVFCERAACRRLSLALRQGSLGQKVLVHAD